MTKVTNRVRVLSWLGLVLTISLLLAADTLSQETPSAQKPAETLYLQLRHVGLDKSRVYHVREAAIDRSSIHISLSDGTIAFTEDVAGHVTGAFFQGDAEVLLKPPDHAERASMALFTGGAILEERFSTAYFRFDDNTFAELQPRLRPTDEGEEFIKQWGETARNLAPMDALQLFINLSRFLPQEQAPSPVKTSGNVLWHARVLGGNLGTFDLYYDSSAEEQISVGQNKTVEGITYFDIWTSFVAPDQPKTGIGDFDVDHYKIRATIHLPTQLNAEAWLQLTAKTDCQRTLVFELSRFLQVKQVEADGHPVEFVHNQALEGTELSRLGNDQMAVVLPSAIKAGKQVTLHFVYGGDVLSDAGGGLIYVGARGTWYPNQRPAMSNFDLEFQSPAGWTLIATGKKVEEKSTSVNGEQITRWASERPLPVAGFNLGKYEHAVARAGNVQVDTYASKDVENAFPTAKGETETVTVPTLPGMRTQPRTIQILPPPPPSPARNARAVAENAAQAVDFFSKAFGPYPYSSLSMTQKPGVISQGWPGLVFLSSFSFLNEGEKSHLEMAKVTRTITNAVIAHETAHQWWGDLVNWDGYRDQWLIEALADYSSLMLLETQDPARFHAVLESYRSNLLQKNKNGEVLMSAGPVTLGTRLSSSRFPEGYTVISYERGVWLLHMLRNMLLDAERRAAPASSTALGSDPFIRTLRKVRTQYENRTLSTREFIAMFEADLPQPLWHDGKKSLDWFYDGWLSGTAIPRIELNNVKFEGKPGAGVTVTGKIMQKEAPDNTITLVPIYAVIAGKNKLIGQVFADDIETSFRLAAPSGTRKV
ncbi:MAG TPA: M1 family aminopeptidase, partial [Terriglobales bacterium]|nr:M1 family aminopeptidase [Terriglobales bacterium]